MPTEETAPTTSGLDISKILLELDVPFSPSQVRWRLTTTSTDKKRGQVVPYADPRAYTDRLNALFSPKGWTRDYKVKTMNKITRMKKGESILSGKVLVTCTVTIFGLWSHSGTGEEWADDDNSMTSADAQAFKRACSCFGLGRYFYDIPAVWVELNQNREPVKVPVLSGWALPENWRKGMRPSANNGNGKRNAEAQGKPSKGTNHVSTGEAVHSSGDGSTGNGHDHVEGSDDFGSDLDERILGMEKEIGSPFYLNILREYGRVNHPKRMRDQAVKRKVLQMLESATRGFGRLEAVAKRLEPKTVEALLAKLQAPPLSRIADIKTLQNVVLGLEELAGPNHPHAA